MKKIFFIVSVLILVAGCQTDSKKIDSSVEKEKKELSKWLNKTETELKINFGTPDKIDFLNSGNRNYIYIKEKLKVKCVRNFEINPKNIVVGFTSKNCF